MGGPQRHTPVGRNHPGALGHPPPLNHRTHHHLDSIAGPPPPPPHRPRGCHHHTNGGRPHNSSPHPHRPNTPASIVRTYDGTSGPHPMASHHHHHPTPNDHTHTWQQRWEDIRGDLLQEHLGLTCTQQNPPTGTMSRPSTTRHTHPGIMGVGHAHIPTSGGRHQDRNIHPASSDPDPAPQHPTRLHHLVGISRPQHPHPLTSPPPLDTDTTALLQAAAASATQVAAPETLGPQYLVETKVAPHAKA